ncbi:MAG TPA: alpha-2-macroglobulin family protein, partial [Bacteroidia bacterium]|nr:alpha-2-macroglobulin family protein [Bacteroidia bacterium]
MAVAYKDKSFGSASKSMVVADPLVVNTGLPRFFSPGDEIEMPVNISNTTAKNANTTVTISITGPVEASTTTEKVTVSANREGNTVFKLKALPVMGNAKIKVSVNGMNETFVDETEITVRPATSLLKTATSGTMQAGQNKTLELDADFIPSSVEARLVVSKNPMAEFIDRFQYLVHYPHGCAEQTISAAFPQLYFAEFVKGAVNKKKIRLEGGESDLNPSYNVKEAVRKIQGMQLYNGAVSYWQGGYSESWWSSVYAAHFLIECKKAGYDVDNSVLDRLLEYINYRTNSKLVESYPYYENGQLIDHRKYVAREIVYSLYVLSRAGKPNRPVMNYYKANQGFLTTDEKYMLAGAFALSSDK